MDNLKFAQFLLDRNIVNEETVFEALTIQQRMNPCAGQIAIREGYLTAKQALSTLSEQAGSYRYFGELAVELGYMTRQNMERILNIQHRCRPGLGEILVEMEKIDSDVCEKLLQKFHALQPSQCITLLKTGAR